MSEKFSVGQESRANKQINKQTISFELQLNLGKKSDFV